jgi:hypothetical protein
LAYFEISNGSSTINDSPGFVEMWYRVWGKGSSCVNTLSPLPAIFSAIVKGFSACPSASSRYEVVFDCFFRVATCSALSLRRLRETCRFSMGFGRIVRVSFVWSGRLRLTVKYGGLSFGAGISTTVPR